MTCTSCKQEGLFKDGWHCEACYSKLYSTIESLKKEVMDLHKEAAKLGAQLMRIEEENKNLKQSGLFDA